MMRLRYVLLAGLALLSACATVLDERRTSVMVTDGFYRGEVYEIVTQTVQGQNRTYERTRVVYWGRSSVCILDSPRDCELAAKRLIDRRFQGLGL